MYHFSACLCYRMHYSFLHWWHYEYLLVVGRTAVLEHLAGIQYVVGACRWGRAESTWYSNVLGWSNTALEHFLPSAVHCHTTWLPLWPYTLHAFNDYHICCNHTQGCNDSVSRRHSWSSHFTSDTSMQNVKVTSCSCHVQLNY